MHFVLEVWRTFRSEIWKGFGLLRIWQSLCSGRFDSLQIFGRICSQIFERLCSWRFDKLKDSTGFTSQRFENLCSQTFDRLIFSLEDARVVCCQRFGSLFARKFDMHSVRKDLTDFSLEASLSMIRRIGSKRSEWLFARRFESLIARRFDELSCSRKSVGDFVVKVDQRESGRLDNLFLEDSGATLLNEQVV